MIDEWLGAEDAISIADEASVSAARQEARDVARAHHMSDVDGARFAAIASELAMNQRRHARYGQIAIRPTTRGGIAASRSPRSTKARESLTPSAARGRRVWPALS